jgi:hypothetical protein
LILKATLKGGFFNNKNSGKVSPESLLRAAPQGKIPSPKKSPPFVPHGLHALFCGFRTVNPSVVFFCHTFCKWQKRRLHSNRHHRAALAPEKNNPKLLYITCSYIRSPPDGETIGINIT